MYSFLLVGLLKVTTKFSKSGYPTQFLHFENHSSILLQFSVFLLPVPIFLLCSICKFKISREPILSLDNAHMIETLHDNQNGPNQFSFCNSCVIFVQVFYWEMYCQIRHVKIMIVNIHSFAVKIIVKRSYNLPEYTPSCQSFSFQF